MSECLVCLDGRVITDPELKADYGIEKIMECRIVVAGTNSRSNIVTINYSNATGLDLKTGDVIYLEGDIRSLRQTGENGARSLKIYVYAKRVTMKEPNSELSVNKVEIRGILSSTPKTRKSYSNSNIDVTELIVRIVRTENRFSYIPVTAWNNLARLTSKLDKDSEVVIEGRIQSHFTTSQHLMVEVSASRVDLVNTSIKDQ